MQYSLLNPLEKAKQVEDLVIRGDKRKYYRFRLAPYYGGIATADVVGCCFQCVYCWNYQRNLNPHQSKGDFYSPTEVAERLIFMAHSKNITKLRITGGEPILGHASFCHLYEILNKINKSKKHFCFILETNGLFLGLEDTFVQQLSEFKNLYVRVSLKGTNEFNFAKISGVETRFFSLPFKGLRALLKNNIIAWPAIISELFNSQEINEVKRKLKSYSINPEDLEIEYLEAYPFVINNLRKRGIKLNL
ncbi:MAG: radical SAM protein [Candidatus Omnitrophica bacterium]|nr:radical SAM protein [Candidatus Omnitrophota bacterium]